MGPGKGGTRQLSAVARLHPLYGLSYNTLEELDKELHRWMVTPTMVKFFAPREKALLYLIFGL